MPKAKQYSSIQKEHDEAVAKVRAKAEAELDSLLPMEERINELRAYLGNNEAPAKMKPKAAASVPKVRTRRNGKKTLGDKAVEMISREPGISTAELADKLKVNKPHLYQLLANETKKGRIEKPERGKYVPVG